MKQHLLKIFLDVTGKFYNLDFEGEYYTLEKNEIELNNKYSNINNDDIEKILTEDLEDTKFPIVKMVYSYHLELIFQFHFAKR